MPGLLLVAMLLASTALHLGTWKALGRYAALFPRIESPKSRTVEVAVVQKPEPPPPEPEPAPEPPPPPPPKVVKLDQPKPRPKIAPPQAPPADAPPPPADIPPDAPPPPSVEAANPTPQPVVLAGIQLSNTSPGGSFSVGVGNTLMGAPTAVAPKPEDVKPYKAERYVPAYQVTEQAGYLGNISADQLQKYYPEQARRDGEEGEVRARLTIDDDGSVVKVVIVSHPGHGFDEAARKVLRLFRFRPAKVNGQAVATEIVFNLVFELPY